jgi:ABC-type Mn/Zn transport systems, ATPase component
MIKPSSGNVWQKPQLKIGYMPQKLHIDRTLPLSVERFLSIPKRVDQSLMLQGFGRCRRGLSA